MKSQRLSQCRHIALVSAALGAVLLWTAAVHAGAGNKSDSKVKATVKSAKADDAGNQVVAIDLEVEKGWYIYADKVGNELLEPNAIAVKVGGKPVKVKYPEPIVKKDDVVGDYKIYKGTVQLLAAVPSAANTPVEFQISVSACHEERGICLQQGTVKVTTR
jgi:DsbC/DsbD-like thiol-disulfide interchange protein